MKTSSTTRKFVFIILSAYFAVLTIVFGILILSGSLTAIGVWNGFIYTGAVILVIGFLLLGSKGDKWSGAAKSRHVQSDAHFKEWRTRERPIEAVAWALILAAALIMLTGYLLANAMI
jgi:hypothetical protein